MKKSLSILAGAMITMTVAASPALASNTYAVDTADCVVTVQTAGMIISHQVNIAVGDSVTYTVVASEAPNRCIVFWDYSGPANGDYAATVDVGGVDFPSGVGSWRQIDAGATFTVTVSAGTLDVDGAGVIVYIGPGLVPTSVTPQQVPYTWTSLVHLSSTPDELPATGVTGLVPVLAAIVLAAGSALVVAGRSRRPGRSIADRMLDPRRRCAEAGN